MMKISFKPLFVTGLFVIIRSTLFAQATDNKQQLKAVEVKNMVDSTNYVFKATYVIPKSSTGVTLTKNYYIKILKDTIRAALPYMGKTISSVIPTDEGLRFISTSFKYSTNDDGQGGWDITIKVNERNITLPQVRVIKMNISPSGFATLNISSADRQSISYSGYLEPKQVN